MFRCTFMQARRQDSVTGGGAEINFGGSRGLFMWIREGHGGTRNLSQVWNKWTSWRPKIQRDYPAEIRNSNVFFPAENRWSPKKKGLHPKNVMKSGVSPQKLRKYRWQTPTWASICTPVAPSLLISSGTVLAWGGTIFVWGGTSSHLGGTRGRNVRPVGAGPALMLP